MTATSTRRELTRAGHRIAAEPEMAGLVRHDRPSATSSSSGATTTWRWVIMLETGNDTGFHDHDVSRGAVTVVEGEVSRSASRSAGRVAAPPRPGQIFAFSRPTSIACSHATAAARPSPSTPLAAAVADGGVRGGAGRRRCARDSVSYGEELRPVDATAA